MTNLQEIKNQIVLVRVAFDLPTLEDTARIYDAIPTIKQLLLQNNTMVLATKWGRPKAQESELSTRNLLPVLSNILSESLDSEQTFQLNYLNQFEDFENARVTILNSHQGPFKNNIFLLENTHFSSDESSKDQALRLDLAKKYSQMAEVFVDEAFPSSHRAEATNHEIKTLLPSLVGISYENEVTNLNRLSVNPEKPFYIIMAGAKLETKLELLVKMAEKADKIFVGGLLSFTLIEASKHLYPDLNFPELFDSPIETDFLETAKKLLNSHPETFILPMDFVYNTVDGKKIARDLGPKSIISWSELIKPAKTIFWNGTLGQYEVPPFDKATTELAKAVTELENCFKVIGGGDTNSSLSSDILHNFDFVSMGGGATLEFLSK